MRLANLKGRLTTFVDDEPVDVETASKGQFGSDAQLVYEQWNQFRAWGNSIGAHGGGSVDPTELGAPVPKPQQVFAIGLNYRAHAEEAGYEIPGFPPTFTKFPSCIVGPDTAVPLASDTSDWEVELVVVIGQAAHRVEESRAWEHIAGLTVGQDISERERQLFGQAAQYSLGKSFPGYGPIGPWLVTPDELADRNDLAIGCAIDGEVVQASRTSDLIYSVPQLVARLSSVVTLRPGDLIFTGTPSGVGHARSPQRFLRPGQQLVSTIEGIGALTTRVITGA